MRAITTALLILLATLPLATSFAASNDFSAGCRFVPARDLTNDRIEDLPVDHWRDMQGDLADLSRYCRDQLDDVGPSPHVEVG